jgi:hypothetical protein
MPVLREEVEARPAALVLAPDPTDMHAVVETVSALLTGDYDSVDFPVILGHLSKCRLRASQSFLIHGERVRPRTDMRLASLHRESASGFAGWPAGEL